VIASSIPTSWFIKIPFDDPTSNVEIICPTNHYSKSLYNPNKQTMIIYTQSIKDNIYNYYEPIYTVKNHEAKKINITPFFNIRNPYISPSIKRILTKVIVPLMTTRCKPLNNMKEYTFKHFGNTMSVNVLSFLFASIFNKIDL
jgi:hypothetical protein